MSSRKVLQALVASFDVPADTFGAVCIVVDKLDKLPADQVGSGTSIRDIGVCCTSCLLTRWAYNVVLKDLGSGLNKLLSE